MTLRLNDYKGDTPTWCPGCGDFGVLAAVQRALLELQIPPEKTVVVGGIGCSSKISEYANTYGFHTIHGRALPVAQGAKMANPELTVIAAGGDGDGYGIGVGHFTHAARRNIDITYLVMDNQIYGLTKGQTSPRSEHGTVTKTTVLGNKEYPIDPLSLSLINGSTFVAQGFSGNIKELTEIVKKAILHKGFSHVNVFSPCVTYNKTNTYQFFKENLSPYQENPFKTREEAVHYIRSNNNLVTGILYEETRDDFQKQLGIEWNMIGIPEGNVNKDEIKKIEREFK